MSEADARLLIQLLRDELDTLRLVFKSQIHEIECLYRERNTLKGELEGLGKQVTFGRYGTMVD